MKNVVWDTESDGLVHELTRIHCLSLRDLDSNEVISCADQEGHVPIEQGLEILAAADVSFAHNAVRHDIPALKKVYPRFEMRGKVRDTLVTAQRRFSHIADLDRPRIAAGELPAKTSNGYGFAGSQSLESWGRRLGVFKGDYSAEMKAKGIDPWAQWNPAMSEYCDGDTETTRALVLHLRSAGGMSGEWIEMEHQLAEYLYLQEQNGVPLNRDKAVALTAELAARREILGQALREQFGTWEVKGKVHIPKRDNKTLGYKKGVPVQKWVTKEFNANSRDHIADRLTNVYGWQPSEFTPAGKPQITDKTLEALENVPGAEKIVEFLLVGKRLGQISEGNQAWLKCAKTNPVTARDHVHGRIKQSFAVTGRASHVEPNMSAVPKVGKPYGAECRELFEAPEGYVQVGADAASLEARVGGHYLAKYDGGAYAKMLLEGDVHTANRIALGLPGDTPIIAKIARDGTKNWYYAWMFGAGPPKLGKMLAMLRTPDGRPLIEPPKGGWTDKKLAAFGKARGDEFLKNTPAFAGLKRDITASAKRGYLMMPDGSRTYIRSEHSAVNSLFQGGGAAICKAWICRYNVRLTEKYGPQGWGQQWAAMLWSHDEVQLAVRPEIAEDVCTILVESIRGLTEHFKWRVPLDGEAKIGRNWKDTH